LEKQNNITTTIKTLEHQCLISSKQTLHAPLHSIPYHSFRVTLHTTLRTTQIGNRQLDAAATAAAATAAAATAAAATAAAADAR